MNPNKAARDAQRAADKAARDAAKAGTVTPPVDPAAPVPPVAPVASPVVPAVTAPATASVPASTPQVPVTPGSTSLTGTNGTGGGLINSASTYDPATWNVTNDQTVQGQVKSIIAEDSPLQQQAAARSLQQMNSRGLINSSMAITAGQSALYDAALPIANADASINAQAANFNAGSRNSAHQFTAGAQNTLNTQQNAISANTTAAARAQEYSLATQSIDNAFKTAIANADIASREKIAAAAESTKLQLANIEADYKTLMNTSNTASDVMRTSMPLIAQILSDPSMDAAAKETAINNLLTTARGTLNMIGSANGVDLTPFLFDLGGTDEAPAPVTQTPEITPAQLAATTGLIRSLYDTELGRVPEPGAAELWAQRFGAEIDATERAQFDAAVAREIAGRTAVV